jgi:hypothetical protein
MDHDNADAQQNRSKTNHYWRLESAKPNQGLKSHQQWQHMILQKMGSNCTRNKERKNYTFSEPDCNFWVHFVHPQFCWILIDRFSLYKWVKHYPSTQMICQMNRINTLVPWQLQH